MTLTGVTSLTGILGISSTDNSTVALDACYPGGTAASGASISSLSYTHVCNGGNKSLLVLYVSLGQTTSDAGLSLSATYAGVSMTSVLGPIHSGGATRGFVQMFRLVAPAPGANTVSITVTGGTADLTAASISFNNVNQTTPIQNATSATGSSTAPSVTVTSATGNVVIDALGVGSNITATGKTFRSYKNLNLLSAGGNGATSISSGAASVTMSYTVVTDQWAIIGADIVYSL